MQYRQLSPTGDYTVGQAFLANSPACVAQAISTRLRLWLAEWFVDTSDGTPWMTQVLGKLQGKSPDAALKQRILGTPGVTSISAYASSYDGNARTFTVTVSVNTQYSINPVTVTVVAPT